MTRIGYPSKNDLQDALRWRKLKEPQLQAAVEALGEIVDELPVISLESIQARRALVAATEALATLQANCRSTEARIAETDAAAR